MMEFLRNFLSGRRLIFIAILLAIPFVFFGSTSFGTTFTSYGTVNGEPVTQTDVNLASSQVSQRLQTASSLQHPYSIRALSCRQQDRIWQ